MEMLWGSGKDDVAGYAAMKPALHAPDTHFNYSSGSTNIVARHLGEIVGGGAEGMLRFMRARLFDAIGITSANPKFDGHGTFKGSSFCFCTAQDFARFGLLYLRDGLWDGRRVLPAGWVDTARTVVSSDPTKAHEHYGLHWWINDGGETFAARGYEGQRIVVAPGKDAVVVRLGRSSLEEGPRMHARVLGVVGVL
jgi:CubicO group peptidase (beta-lactamase class C family)